MKIVADEGVDRQVVEQLRRENHEVIYVAELAAGISDDEVLRLANDPMETGTEKAVSSPVAMLRSQISPQLALAT